MCKLLNILKNQGVWNKRGTQKPKIEEGGGGASCGRGDGTLLLFCWRGAVLALNIREKTGKKSGRW